MEDSIYKAIFRCDMTRDTSFVFLLLAATFQHLFGPPTPAAVRRMRNKKFYEGDMPKVRKSHKPLPGEFYCLGAEHLQLGL